MKKSIQNELIKSIIINKKVHLKVEDVLIEAKKTIPTIGIATVYRNLNRLANEGLINQITTNEGFSYFDGFIDEHNHFICKNCNNIRDITVDEIIIKEKDFIIEKEKIILYGICNECKKNN